VLITAGTPDLQKFIRKYAGSPEVFTEPSVFYRVR
jgi:hypothetical protein